MSVDAERAERSDPDFAELQRTRLQLQTILDCAAAAIISTTTEGIITTFNREAERMLGYAADELLGKHTPAVFHDFAEVVAHARELSEQLGREIVPGFEVFVTKARAGATETREWTYVRKSGARVPVSLSVSAMLDERGELVGFLGIATEISARKRAEEERLLLERQVQHAQKLESLGVLAGGIAHDFNNLLMAILGNSDLALLDIPSDSPARESILEIEKATHRAAELAQQMLAYSGKGKFVISPIVLSDLVRDMATLLEVSISKKVELVYDFATALPSFEGDATQIGQVIMNLITNASEAIGDRPGVIEVSTGVIDCDRTYLDGLEEALPIGRAEPLPEGRYVYFEVGDSGCGMSRETLARIFDPFFTTKFTGRGLGMSAVLGIVRGHAGALAIYSELGKGTTFRVVFPVDGVRIVAQPEPNVSEWRGQGTVLVADDEPMVRRVGVRTLERLGFRVVVASDGREAVERFREHADAIVCVLLDLTMPELDGHQVFRELRAIRPSVPVVLCSGYSEQAVTGLFAGEGLAGFIQKPYTMHSLRETLQRVLSG
ncbi:response regulator [Nannocystaceae bacterium ST9]